MMDNKDSQEEFKKKLTPEQYRVLRENGTEAPFSGKYVHHKEKGVYKCAACGNELFSSDTKFDSGTGWPSFTDPMNKENIILEEDISLGMSPVREHPISQPPRIIDVEKLNSILSNGMSRVEVACKHCGSHLGHVFPDGPGDSGNRYCINSVCLIHEKDEARRENN